jgi:hypothetical protein
MRSLPAFQRTAAPALLCALVAGCTVYHVHIATLPPMAADVFIDKQRVCATSEQGLADIRTGMVSIFKKPLLEVKNDRYYGNAVLSFSSASTSGVHARDVRSRFDSNERLYSITFLLDSTYAPLTKAQRAEAAATLRSSDSTTPAMPSPSRPRPLTVDSFSRGSRRFTDRGSHEFSGALSLQCAFSNIDNANVVDFSPSYRYFPVNHLYVGPLLHITAGDGTSLYMLGFLAGFAANNGTSILYADAGLQWATGSLSQTFEENGSVYGFGVTMETGLKFPFNKFFAIDIQVSYSHLDLNAGDLSPTFMKGDALTFGFGFSALVY